MTQSSSQRRALVVRNDFSPFGNKLIESGYVDPDQMQQALMETRKSGRPLIEILESMTGRQLPPDLLRQYKKQQLFELNERKHNVVIQYRSAHPDTLVCRNPQRIDRQ